MRAFFEKRDHSFGNRCNNSESVHTGTKSIDSGQIKELAMMTTRCRERGHRMLASPSASLQLLRCHVSDNVACANITSQGPCHGGTAKSTSKTSTVRRRQRLPNCSFTVPVTDLTHRGEPTHCLQSNTFPDLSRRL